MNRNLIIGAVIGAAIVYFLFVKGGQRSRGGRQRQNSGA